MIPERKIRESNQKELFGEWLLNRGQVNEDDLRAALERQSKCSEPLGEILGSMGVIAQEQIMNLLSEYLGVEYFVLDDMAKVDFNIAREIPESIAKRFQVVAVKEEAGKIVLAMVDPFDIVAIDTVSFKLKRELAPVISSKQQIMNAIQTVYHGSYLDEESLKSLVEMEVAKDDNTILLDGPEIEEFEFADIDSKEAAEKAPVIRFVDLMLSQAVKSGASDVHVEPQDNSVSIRMRVDGVLRYMVPPPARMFNAVVTRIKILSMMNIAERRLPQDGRFKIKAPGREIDVRVSAIPTIYGEKIVMRILDKMAVNHKLDEIGFEPELLDRFKMVLSQPHGIVIVTGPTGSGKSTTLYSALNYLKDPRKNITTGEDPVEYRLDGINQMQIKPIVNLDFATCLRAILRQDPDIVFIGEIRDKETVDIAIKASLTGHLVLSTFHTNDAPSALTRLAFMGVDRYLLASTVNLVVAQRLVKRICEHCKEEVQLEEHILKRLKIDPEQARQLHFFRGKGCNMCNGTGYKGRLPIFEFLLMEHEIRNAVINGADEATVRRLSRQKP